MNLGVGRLERYVLSRTLLGVAGALAVIGAVILLIDFVEVSRTVGGRGDAGFPRLLWLTLLKAPSTILTLLPFAFLFGTLAAFVGLNRRSELIAMRAAGVSAWRFILPATIAAFVVGGVTVSALNPLAAMLGAEFEQSRDAVLEEFQTSTPKDTWLRQATPPRRSSSAPARTTRPTAPCGSRTSRCSNTGSTPTAAWSSSAASRPTRRG